MGTVIPFRSRAQLQQNKYKPAIFRVLKSRCVEDIKQAVFHAKMGYTHRLIDIVGKENFVDVGRDNVHIVEEYLHQLEEGIGSSNKEFNRVVNKVYWIKEKD